MRAFLSCGSTAAVIDGDAASDRADPPWLAMLLREVCCFVSGVQPHGAFMGILSFFRRFRRGLPVADAVLDDLEVDSPRCHHYTLVHQVLRKLAFDDPVVCLAALGSPQRRELLEKVWSAVDSHCARRGNEADFEIGDVNEQITVESGGVELIQTEKATVQATVETRQIVDLPINGRSPAERRSDRQVSRGYRSTRCRLWFVTHQPYGRW